MKDPIRKSKPWDIQRKDDNSNMQPRRKHTNKKFYNSKSWRSLRIVYIDTLIEEQRNRIIETFPAKQQLSLLNDIPLCERCLDLLDVHGEYNVKRGKELDHIKPINPVNALDTCNGVYGEPLSINNLQLLCPEHHAKKSARDSKIVRLRNNEK